MRGTYSIVSLNEGVVDSNNINVTAGDTVRAHLVRSFPQ